jgi:hypothetical protein
MARAIHRLHSKTLILYFEQKYVVFVVLIVAGGLPQLEIEHIGRYDFLIASHSIFLPQEVSKLVVNLGSIRIPKSTSWRQMVEVEKVLMLSHDSVISFSGFLDKVNVLV